MNTELELKCHAVIKLLYRLNVSCKNAKEVIDLGGFIEGIVVTEYEIFQLHPVLIGWGVIYGTGTGFTLTDNGKLWAEQLIEQEKTIYKSKIPISEITTYIDNWLPEIPMYGDFTFPFYASHKYRIVQTEEHGKHEVERQREIDVREVSMSHLIFEGFAKINHDISKGTLLYFELTDNGRMLKKLGSLKDFADWKDIELNKEKEKKELELRLLKSQNDFQQINNAFIAKQADLIASQIETNKNVVETNTSIRKTNLHMKIILVATILATLFSAYPSFNSMMSNKKEMSLQQSIDIKNKEIEQLEVENRKLGTQKTQPNKTLLNSK